MIDLIIKDRTTAGKILSHPVRSKEITHVISIFDSSEPEGDGYRRNDVHDKPCAGFHKFTGKKLALQFDDLTVISENGYVAPTEHDVQRIISFAEDIIVDISLNVPVKLLVHCYAGISRSTAAAYIVLARIMPVNQFKEAMAKVFEVREEAFPNIYMVEMADKLMDRNGNLIKQLPAVGRTYGWA
jgi:predicted protein tyrosine phosphatase